MDAFQIPAIVAPRPYLTYAAIVAHPELPAARKRYLDAFLAVYGDDPFLSRLLIQTNRFLLFNMAVVLGASHDPARRETWFTVGRLKRELLRIGISSDRQIDSLIARLREVGFLTLERSAPDRRIGILKPGEKMLAHDRDWLAAHYVGLAHLSPFGDYDPALRGDPAYQLAHRRAAFDFIALGAQLVMSVPEMLLFFDRAAGHMVLAALLHGAMSQSDDTGVAIRYADIGDRFGVSRTHVRALLQDAEAADLVRLHARGGQRVEILPRLWNAYDRGIAGGMFLHDLIHAVVIDREPAAARG